MEKGCTPVDRRHAYSASFAKSSKAIGVLWGVFSICFAIIIVVVFMQPHWIGDSQLSVGSGHFGLWQRCSPSEINKESLCVGDLEDLESVASPAFRAATILVGVSVIASLVCICCCLLFFFLSTSVVFSIAGSIQLLTALLMLVAICIYPMGFDTPEVIKVCGHTTRAYNLGECEVRWAYLLAILGVLDSIGLSALAFLLSSRSRKLKEHILMQRQPNIEPIYGNSIYKGHINGDYISEGGASLAGSRKSLNLHPVVMFPNSEQPDSRSEYLNPSRLRGPTFRA